MDVNIWTCARAGWEARANGQEMPDMLYSIREQGTGLTGERVELLVGEVKCGARHSPCDGGRLSFGVCRQRLDGSRSRRGWWVRERVGGAGHLGLGQRRGVLAVIDGGTGVRAVNRGLAGRRPIGVEDGGIEGMALGRATASGERAPVPDTGGRVRRRLGRSLTHPPTSFAERRESRPSHRRGGKDLCGEMLCDGVRSFQ